MSNLYPPLNQSRNSNRGAIKYSSDTGKYYAVYNIASENIVALFNSKEECELLIESYSNKDEYIVVDFLN